MKITGDPPHSLAVCEQRPYLGCLLGIGFLDGSPSELDAFLPRSRESCHDALTDHGPLELREHSHHLKHGSPRWCGSVESLLVEEEVNALRVKLLEHVEKVREGAAQP